MVGGKIVFIGYDVYFMVIDCGVVDGVDNVVSIDSLNDYFGVVIWYVLMLYGVVVSCFVFVIVLEEVLFGW